MIEVKLSFPDAAALVAFFTGKGVQVVAAAVAETSATVTPEKQQAARDSTAAGKAEKAKADKAPKEVKDTAEKPKADDVSDAVVKTSTVTPPTYEASGIAKLIGEAQIKDRDATVAAIKALGGLTAEGKVKGSAIPPEKFADAIEMFTKIIG